MMIPWRQQYGDAARDEMLGLISGVDASREPDLAVQSYKEDSDINVLMRRFGVTGQLTVPGTLPRFGDFSEVGSYQDALNAVIDAQERFAALPSKIRNRFRNDPIELMEFLEDENNRAEGEELGLFDIRPQPDPLPGPADRTEAPPPPEE